MLLIFKINRKCVACCHFKFLSKNFYLLCILSEPALKIVIVIAEVYRPLNLFWNFGIIRTERLLPR